MSKRSRDNEPSTALMQMLDRYPRNEEVASLLKPIQTKLERLYTRDELASMLIALSDKLDSHEARISELEGE